MPSQRFRRGAVAAATTVFLIACLYTGSPRVEAATACPTTIAYGATVSCSLDKKGEVDGFALTAAAGDVIFAHVRARVTLSS